MPSRFTFSFMHILAIDWVVFTEKLILIIAVVSGSLVVAMYSTYAERKVAAIIQDRRGPNRAGPFGILQPLADGLFQNFHQNFFLFLVLASPC